MRKRFAFFRPDTCAKRWGMIYSLDSYDLQLKRILKFLVVLPQRCPRETLFENSRFWRRAGGAGELAQCCPRITLRTS